MDSITEQEGDATAALLVEHGLKGFGDGVLARIVQPSQENNEALLCSWWVAFPKGLDDTSTYSHKSRENTTPTK